jgi:hypothetical protein
MIPILFQLFHDELLDADIIIYDEYSLHDPKII